MPRLVIEKFDKGLTPDWPLKGGETLQDKRGDAQFALLTTNVNPLQLPDYIQPGFGFSNSSFTNPSAVTTNINAIAAQSVGTGAYGIGATKLYLLNSTNYFTVVNNTPATPTWPHTITSAIDYSQHDVITAQQNFSGTNAECAFYSYNTNAATGAGALGRFDITNNSNWGAGNSADGAYNLTTNDAVDSGGEKKVPRPMILGTNGILYVGSGYKVDSLDLTTSGASIVTNALDIPATFEIQSLAFYKGQLVVAAQSKGSSASVRGQVAIFFWDTLSPSFSDPIYIKDDFCGALIADSEDMYLFTANSTNGHLRMWDGQGFQVVQELSTAIPKHHAVDFFRDGLIWGDSNSRIWFYGPIKQGLPRSLWSFGSNGTSVTCVKRLSNSGDVLHVTGTNSGTSFIVTQTTTYSTGEYQTPVIDFPHRSTITRIELQFKTLATGASMTLRYLLNGSGSYTNHGTVTFASDGAVTRKVFNERISNVSRLAFDFTWSGAAANEVVIERMIVDYQVPSTKLSS